jgi:single-strand DNA-binding protein
MSINKVILIGNVGQDPQIRATKDGKEIASLSLATSEKWSDKSTGEVKERAEWHNVSIFGGLVNVVKNYVRKGSKLYIEGKLQTDKYTDKNGVEKYITKVVVQGFNSTLQILNKVEAGGINEHNQAKGNAYIEESDEIPY